MSATFKHRLLVWFYDGLVASLGGAINVILSSSTESLINAFMPGTIKTYSPRQLVIQLIVGAAVAWGMYYKQRRPPTIDTEPGTVVIPAGNQDQEH